MKYSFDLKGKKALVTGAARGLGESFAHALAEAGADVAVADICGDDAEKVSDSISSAGRDSMAIRADITSISDIAAMVEATVSRWGRLDIAVNNVGGAIPIKGALEVTEPEWDQLVDLNLKGTFFCAQHEAGAMKAQGHGKIINIASICARITWPEPQAVYSITKAGIVHMTRCLAAEWIKFGIRVNSISPGVTRTPKLFKEVIPVFLNKAPIDRIAEVDDLQGALVYLASDASDFVVGHDIVVDGGYTLP